MCFILVYSFYENIDLAVDKVAFQFSNWEELLGDNYYHYAIWKTLWMAIVVTVAAVILGYIPAYYIARTTFRHKWLRLSECCTVSMITPTPGVRRLPQISDHVIVSFLFQPKQVMFD